MSRWDEAIAWMKGLQKFGIKPGLERMNWMLERLDNPHHRLKFVHIAGTNGKGSTVAYISNVLQEAGYAVGTFTSPGTTLPGQIRLNGEGIPDAVLTGLMERIRALEDELAQTEWGPITAFEAATLLAILYFGSVAFPDFVVLETGLGGRLDSTNVVVPLVTAITNVGHDHMDVLGETLEEIAREKAGIIKRGFPVVTTEENPVPLQVIIQTAEERKAPVYRYGKQFEAKKTTPPDFMFQGEMFDFTGPFASYHQVMTPLAGHHQIKNAALAIMVLEVMRQYYAVYFEREHLVRGIKNVFWPGRFEIYSKKPYLILDGAHNIEGIECLLSTFTERFPDRKARLLFSALGDKNIKEIIFKLVTICEEVIIARMDHPRAADVKDMEMWFRDAAPGLSITLAADYDQALDLWYRQAKDEQVLLATGSLYFIADIRKELGMAQSSCCEHNEKAGG